MRGVLRPAPSLLALAVALSACGGSGDPPNQVVAPAGDSTPAPEPSPSAEVQQLGPAQLAGSLIVVRFDGTALPGYVARALRARRAAGVILFHDNVVSAAQVRRLTRAVHRASRGRGLVYTDQEGGHIRILRWLPPALSAPRQAAAGRERIAGRAAGRALRRLGVDVSLAPVADVATVSGSAMGGRVFGSRPASVARSVADAVRGFRAGGVLPTAKHFPGLGGSTRNTDWYTATVGESPSLAPWRAAIDAGVPLVMAGHARYPRLDRNRIASQSRPILTGLLRERLGFDGVIVTDSMEAAAVRATGSLERSGERSLRAGADLLLTTGRGSYIRLRRYLARAAQRDPGLHRRMEAALARVDRLPALLRSGD
jgi:beta-N-acetylhexosaminidase